MNGDGDVIIIGDWETSSSTGEVKVYQYTSDWGVVSSAIAGGATGDKFGSNVAINDQGDYIAVGAKEALSDKGETYVYYNSSLSAADPGSGGGKVTVKLNGKITIKGTGKITVK
jgi:hypothetical protein